MWGLFFKIYVNVLIHETISTTSVSLEECSEYIHVDDSIGLGSSGTLSFISDFTIGLVKGYT